MSMEKALTKLARQLNAFDEASLMALWDRYAARVQNFEPTKRWEEAALIFGLLQTVRWKNQLFNHHWSETARPQGRAGLTLPSLPEGVEDPFRELMDDSHDRTDADDAELAQRSKRAKVLHFRPRGEDESV